MGEILQPQFCILYSIWRMMMFRITPTTTTHHPRKAFLSSHPRVLHSCHHVLDPLTGGAPLNQHQIQQLKRTRTQIQFQCQRSVSPVPNLSHCFTTTAASVCIGVEVELTDWWSSWAKEQMIIVTGLLFYHRHHLWLVKRKGRNNLIAQQRP